MTELTLEEMLLPEEIKKIKKELLRSIFKGVSKRDEIIDIHIKKSLDSVEFGNFDLEFIEGINEQFDNEQFDHLKLDLIYEYEFILEKGYKNSDFLDSIYYFRKQGGSNYVFSTNGNYSDIFLYLELNSIKNVTSWNKETITNLDLIVKSVIQENNYIWKGNERYDYFEI